MNAVISKQPGATLFLDRDGVINVEKHGDYIRHVNEFEMYAGVTDAIRLLRQKFSRILVVTNQRGIGKGLMQVSDLQAIHEHLLMAVENAGGKIDACYFAPDLATDAPDRKPNTGMALQAKEDFPEIDFEKSIMVGNNLSDMQFGKNMGMRTVFLRTTRLEQGPDPLIDFFYESLLDFAMNI